MPDPVPLSTTATLVRLPATTDGWATPAPLAAAAVLVGVAVRQNDGNYSPAALAWLTAGLIAALLAVARPRLPGVERWGAKALGGVLAAGLVVQTVLLCARLPVRPQADPHAALPFPAVAAAAG